MIPLDACEHGNRRMTLTAHCNPASCLHRYEAFHVFKIFVANPRKPSSVLELLERNKQRLLQFFGTFLTPVSYTHLRAHETGRNLVCRLLLEKKK